jgi:hypothetical protein
MISILASVVINAKSNKIWNFFNNLNENYYTMHPDHIECKCPETRLEQDMVIRLKEVINGKEMKFKLHITSINELKIEYTLKLGVGGAFIIDTQENTTLLTEEVRIGFKSISFIDKIISKLFNKELQAINNHMEDELINIKKTIEGVNITKWG